MNRDLLNRFPALLELEEAPVRILEQTSHVVNLSAGTKVFEAGMPCDNFLMLLSGRIRVQQVSESGREIVLYRVAGGDTCVLTTAFLLAHGNYSAEGIAETDISGLAVPRAGFDRLMAESKRFRDFVFMAFASRIADLMLLVEEVAFGKVDIRLAQRLLELSKGSGTLTLTHQELAVELGTAREVVSRQLKEFERCGWIRLDRGRIELHNRNALEELAHNHRL
jgi:CRP/FNR family transcriptional regulator